MNIFGIICSNVIDVFPIYCDIFNGTSFGYSLSTPESSNLTTSSFFLENTFNCFWKKYFNNDCKILVELGFKTKGICTPEGIKSISLSFFLAPLLRLENFSTPYTHICFTGIVNNKCCVEGVGDLETKYKGFSEYIENENNNHCTFAFVYVSKNELDFTKTERNPLIKEIQVLPNTPINEIINKLSSSFVMRREKYLDFNNAVYSKISRALEENISEEKKFNAQIFLSGNDNSKSFFDFKWFDIFRTAIDMGYKFSLSINISKSLTNNEITSDDMSDELLPKWWEGDISNQQMLTINERLKRLKLFVSNQIEVLKRYVFETYAYETTNHGGGRLDICLNYPDSESIKLSSSNEEQTENAIIMQVDEKRFSSFSNGNYFEYEENYIKDLISPDIERIENTLSPFEEQEVTKIDNPEEEPEEKANVATMNNSLIDIENTKKIIKILDKSEFTPTNKLELISKELKKLKKKNIYLPRFSLYGLPGSGKSTLLKGIMNLYYDENEQFSKDNIHIISSDFIINERIFDDDKNSRHNPNTKASNKKIDAIKEHVIYTREDYESFLGNHDMDIRNLCVEIAIRQSFFSHDMLDLGGKEILIEKTRYLLNDLGFICVFICPDGNSEDENIIFSHEKIEDSEPYFKAYFNYFKNYHSLFNKKKRRNIYFLVKKFKKDNAGYKEPTDWEDFQLQLKNKIFNPRFYFYNRKYDVKIIRRGTDEEIICNILKGILMIHKQRMENDN